MPCLQSSWPSKGNWGPPLFHPFALPAATAATALSTPLLYLHVGFPQIDALIFVAGAVLTGFGSAPLWVMWGEYYARITQAESEFLAPVSAMVAAIAVLIVSAMDGWVAIATVTCFPLLSGLCLALSRNDVSREKGAGEFAIAADMEAHDAAHAHARQDLGHVLRSMGTAGFGILAACLFVCIEGSLWAPPEGDCGHLQFALAMAMAFMLVIGYSITRGPRRVSLSFLHRWMCPVLVAGFGAIVVFGLANGGGIAHAVSIAARFIFCLITQMYFARYAIMGVATPVQAYGLGWIFVHLGDLLGVVGANAIDTGMAAGFFTMDQAVAACMVMLVAATMLVLNDRKTFAADTRPGSTRIHADLAESREPHAAESDASSPTADDIDARIRELARTAALTPRETEVFDLLARGRSIPYVRDALVISKETAATHAKHIYAKLDVHSRQELIDLVSPPAGPSA